MPLSADDIRTLHKYDIAVLLSIEKQMKRYSWVPEENIRKSTKFSQSELEFRLGRVMAKDMVKSSTLPYDGYQLTFKGYDALAVSALVKRGTISALGTLIGVGKESTVYEALGMGTVVLKVHRIGQRSFQSARLSRDYMPEWKHFPWIFASTESAKREFEALKVLQKGGVSVPVPLTINRNVIAMTYIPGVNLNQSVFESPEDAEVVLDEILDNMKKAYDLGYIHNDLSEYNVMVSEKNVWVIDWPQWVEPVHPNAEDILRRDLGNITGYFKKKYRIEMSVEEALSKVVG